MAYMHIDIKSLRTTPACFFCATVIKARAKSVVKSCGCNSSVISEITLLVNELLVRLIVVGAQLF